MAIIDHEYPYSFYHELNLDWILSKLKEWEEDWQGKEAFIANIEQLARDAMASATEAHALAASVSGVAQSAYNTANNASDVAQEAYTLAAGVRSVADNALAAAQSAEAKASTATATAGDAYSLASGVRSVADNAFTIAEGAMDLAESASEAAGIAEQSAQTAGAAAANANNRLDAIADYIVEQGIAGKWSYRKWNSGKQEAWYKEDTEFVTGAKNAFGSLYYKTKPSMNVWGEWYEKPVLLWSVHPTGGGLVGATLKSDALTAAGVYSFDLFCWSSRDVSESLLIDFYVSGRWK